MLTCESHVVYGGKPVRVELTAAGKIVVALLAIGVASIASALATMPEWLR